MGCRELGKTLSAIAIAAFAVVVGGIALFIIASLFAKITYSPGVECFLDPDKIKDCLK